MAPAPVRNLTNRFLEGWAKVTKSNDRPESPSGEVDRKKSCFSCPRRWPDRRDVQHRRHEQYGGNPRPDGFLAFFTHAGIVSGLRSEPEDQSSGPRQDNNQELRRAVALPNSVSSPPTLLTARGLSTRDKESSLAENRGAEGNLGGSGAPFVSTLASRSWPPRAQVVA